MPFQAIYFDFCLFYLQHNTRKFTILQPIAILIGVRQIHPLFKGSHFFFSLSLFCLTNFDIFLPFNLPVFDFRLILNVYPFTSSYLLNQVDDFILLFVVFEGNVCVFFLSKQYFNFNFIEFRLIHLHWWLNKREECCMCIFWQN